MHINRSVYEVFKTQGHPAITYVSRDHGRYERQLLEGLNNRGTLCLITGPSKTGKSTLYTKVAESIGLEALVIRCHGDLRSEEVWRQALEQIDFERTTQQTRNRVHTQSTSGKLGGKVGWAWLAGLVGEVSLGASSSQSESEIRERILAKPSPQHLLPVLQNFSYVLVVEDFHYLNEEVQRIIFQQWKIFVDNEVSIIVVSTTHHAADLTYSNKDLIGRHIHIELEQWKVEDLQEIAKKGFHYLGISSAPLLSLTIAKESIGIPLVTQWVCLRLLLDAFEANPMISVSGLSFSMMNLARALNKVATEAFGSYSVIYDRITRGPRISRRKYNTYELVLWTFAIRPFKSLLTREEIVERLKSLPIDRDKVPPSSSVTSMLKALKKFQDKLPIELLEWNEPDRRLYITEPGFLFYVRWKHYNEAITDGREVYRELAGLKST